jgi:hypothetical protein
MENHRLQNKLLRGVMHLKERVKLQKVMLEVFQQEFQSLNPEFQSILLDDLVTVFHNRLAVLKNIQQNKQTQLHEDNSSVSEPKWLTDDLKKKFKVDVSIKKNGLRVTKLTLKKKKI